MLLTRTLGYRSLGEMRAAMPAGEHALWEAEYNRNPWGEYRDNWHMAAATCNVVASNGVTPPSFDDLMYGLSEVPEQSEADMQALIRKHKDRYNGNKHRQHVD